jgi:hypothetical protein
MRCRTRKCWGLHPSLYDAAASAAEESRQLTVLLVIRRNKRAKGLNGECVRSRPTFHRASPTLAAKRPRGSVHQPAVCSLTFAAPYDFSSMISAPRRSLIRRLTKARRSLFP